MFHYQPFILPARPRAPLAHTKDAAKLQKIIHIRKHFIKKYSLSVFFFKNTCIFRGKVLPLQPILNECIMEATKTVSRRPNMVTVQMSQRRWNRILSLEQTYKLARTIKRSMDQVETAPAMSAEDAVATLRSL